MKRKPIIIILSALTLVLTLTCACVGDLTDNSAQSEKPQESDGEAELQRSIRELEAQIRALLQDQQLSSAESKKEIAALRAEIERLKGEGSTEETTDETDDKNDTEIFKYTVENGTASITKILTDEKNIVIPNVIDGFRVTAISGEALSSDKVESIVISSGIEKIDWFAFKGCPSLVCVTVPDSVISIGYGAFDNASGSFVIRCSRDSFAHRYAKSYGITYDIS